MNIDKKSQNILKHLDELKNKDFSFQSGHILGSMCTQPHFIAKKAYINFLETNIGDPDLFPGTKLIEEKFIKFISNLFHAPKTFSGQIMSGGTEGNITAMWIAKLLSQKKEIIVSEGAHFSFRKIASLMDMKLKTVPLTKDFIVDIKKLKKKINKDTAAVLAIAGSTELGTIDPIPEINELCCNEHIFLHVDAAFGGFVIPFLKKLDHNICDFDFKLKGVSTISVDAHKMGCAAIPLGTLVVKNKKWLDEISGQPNCTSSNRQVGILGTRSGGSVAAGYATVNYLGHNGYGRIVKNCMDNTEHTKKRIEEIGLNLVVKPTMNVIGVKLKKPEKIIKMLSNQGWRVNHIQRLSCIRIVLMPHVKKDTIDEFIPVLEKTCKKVGEL